MDPFRFGAVRIRQAHLLMLATEARLVAELAKVRAKIEKEAGRRARVRRTFPIAADVKAFAQKAYEECQDYVQAACRTEAHFAKQHRKIVLDPALLRGWIQPGQKRLGPDHFSTDSRGGG